MIALSAHMDLPTFIASWQTPKVTVRDLQQGKIKPVLLIDVRSPEEYAEDHIGNSPLIPFTEVEAGTGVERLITIAEASRRAAPQEPTIVLYCHSGARSVKAYQRIAKRGFKFAILSGGITAWRKTISPNQDTAILAKVLP